jgi:hypothetical protein
MDKQPTPGMRQDEEVAKRLRKVAATRMGRRQLARCGVGAGLSGVALGPTFPSAAAHQASTPSASPIAIGEQLDLGNLSPDIPRGLVRLRRCRR